MVAEGKIGYMRRQFKPGRHYVPKEHAMSRSLTRIAADCGLSHVTLAEWEAPLRAVIPGSGERVDLPSAVFAERAGGVSLEALTIALTPDALLATLAALPHAAVRDAALLDALTQQGDRHAENVFIGREGAYFKLIDSRDAALEASGMDSLFLPGTTCFERNRVGNMHIQRPDAVVVRACAHARARLDVRCRLLSPDARMGIGIGTCARAQDTSRLPQTALDYRCHVPGGAIGHDYPPKARTHTHTHTRAWLWLMHANVPSCVQFAECIAWIASASPQEVLERYNLPEMHGRLFSGTMATASMRLQAQAVALRERGFEGALLATRHKNTSSFTPTLSGYPRPPPCCALSVVERGDPNKPFACAPGAEAAVPPAGVPLPEAPPGTFTWRLDGEEGKEVDAATDVRALQRARAGHAP
jgi:hypothetical protein